MSDVLGGALSPQMPKEVLKPQAGAKASAKAGPTISPEMQSAFDRNKGFVNPGENTYQTVLTPEEEKQFQAYIADKSDKQDLGRVDDLGYDLRGWWKAMMAGDKRAFLMINPIDNLKHRSDYWKTPYHKSFSNESQWANKGAPSWNDKNQLVAPDGTVVFDEKAEAEKEGD